MDPKAFQKLVEQAKADPKFFHALVFDTEKVLPSLDFLDQDTKAALVANRPEDVIGRLVSGPPGCDVTCTSSCGGTCAESCGYTTNLQDALRARTGFRLRPPVLTDLDATGGCDVTCTSSCGGTCGSSCGYTTNLSDLVGSLRLRGIR